MRSKILTTLAVFKLPLNSCLTHPTEFSHALRPRSWYSKYLKNRLTRVVTLLPVPS